MLAQEQIETIKNFLIEHLSLDVIYIFGSAAKDNLNHPTTYRGGGFRKKFGQATLILSGWSTQPLACRTLKSTRLLLRSMFSAPLQSAFIIVP